MGQILITFDDGLAIHRDAARVLASFEIKATFGVVTDRIGTRGFLEHDDLEQMSEGGHVIANHGAAHAWLGGEPDKPGLVPSGPEGVLEDCFAGRIALQQWGFHGDLLVVPFGTPNVNGPEHLAEYRKHFRWLRLTIGAPLPEEHGGWTIMGGKRLFPLGGGGPIVGISAASDVRHKARVTDMARWAAELDRLAVICYHSVCHHHGSGMNITWEQFMREIECITGLVRIGLLTPVTPLDLLKRETVGVTQCDSQSS